MSSPRSWICDGVPKDGKEYPNSSGPHAPQENYGPDCVICGLPKEAMQPGKTKVSGNDVGKPPLVPIAAAIALMLLVGGGGWWYVSQQNKNETDGNPTAAISVNPLAIVSDTAINARLISQGEKILLTGGRNFQEKTAAAALFAQGDWNGAIREYQVAANRDPNDPEAKIYLNNAKAKESGNPVAMAVVAPITPRVNEAKEVLRGVAQYQEEYNREFPNRLLEVVVVNEEQASIADSLAQDIINAPLNVLGVLGHGVSNDSRQALRSYEKNNLAVLSPLNTAIANSTVKTISLDQTKVLLRSYQQQVGETLANYTAQTYSPAAAAVFYNSDIGYSQEMKDEFAKALSQKGGKIVKEIDVTVSGFEAASAIREARQAGANVAYLALTRNKVDIAIALAKANNNQLKLLGADELYNPTILVRGGGAIEGLVLAVPWRWRKDDPFARDATDLWQGRVSWRTATTYDATQALVAAISQHPGDRPAISQALNKGITLNKTATEFNIFNDIPLVKAVSGTAGPSGSKHQFDAI